MDMNRRSTRHDATLAEEKEFLLPSGSTFKVTKVERQGGVKHIHLELTSQ